MSDDYESVWRPTQEVYPPRTELGNGWKLIIKQGPADTSIKYCSQILLDGKLMEMYLFTHTKWGARLEFKRYIKRYHKRRLAATVHVYSYDHYTEHTKHDLKAQEEYHYIQHGSE